MSPINRRQFLQYSGAAAGTTILGCTSEYRIDPEIHDLCVVGSGFAGIFLGLETVKQELKTVVVEAGPDIRNKENADPEVYEKFKVANSGSIEYPANGLRRIEVGGTSNQWGGAVTRMRPNDFKLESEFGLAVDWPISYDDLQPYYCVAENLLDTKGYPAVSAEPPRQCEFPFSKPGDFKPVDIDLEGYSTDYFPVAGSRRNGNGGPVRLVDKEVPEFKQSPHATLLSDLQAIMLVTRDGRTIDHLQVRAPDGQLRGIRARIFVVAAGTIETPRLLQLSKSEWFPDGLGNEFNQLGRYFTVHPSLEGKVKLKPGLGYTDAQHRTSSLSDPYRRIGLNACHFQFDINNENYEKGRLRAQPEIMPQPENRVQLTSNTDWFGIPQPEITLNYSESDLATLDRCREFILNGRKLFGNDPAPSDISKRFRGHPSGTCRMSASPQSGVVDSKNRVFGVENLYLSGACVFPTAGTANPTNTVVAMTLRLADIIVAKLRS